MEITKFYGLKITNFLFISLCLLLLGGTAHLARGQAEIDPWGNLRGIRVDGQLMKFETSIYMVSENGLNTLQTAKERQTPTYSHQGNKKIIKTKLDTLDLMEVVTDKGTNEAEVEVRITSQADTSIAGAYLSINLPKSKYNNGFARIITSDTTKKSSVSLEPGYTNERNKYLRGEADGIRFISPDRQLQVMFSTPTHAVIKNNHGKNNIKVFLMVASGQIQKSKTEEMTFTFKATGKIDKRPLTLVLNTSKPGREFDGMGGNFRLQNAQLDPQVIDYNLNHLRVAWGRVELPWHLWQPEKNMDPVKAAKQGKLNPKVKASMEMAQRLDRQGIPIILSAWYPPKWAVNGKLRYQPVHGIWGNALDSLKTDEIYKSITKYIRYLKDHYDVNVKIFSFNESDLGINVRQTGEEHDRLIKGLGAYFAAHGLDTKLLLGDTSDANGFNFIKPAMADSAAHQYIGALSFHSWRGWTNSTLTKWADAAKKLHLPLIIGEGSIDAAAWHYPQIFQEPMYAREEINLYVRILSICQPKSILQWQLTSDYSDMAGGGIWGNDADSLHPTQRFWNLKQLGSTPKGLHFIPITSNRANVTAAAMGNNSKKVYAIHLVNNGPTRQITLTGLPKDIHQLQMYVTDDNQDMKQGRLVRVNQGKATFILSSTSFTSLMTDITNP